MNEIWSQNSSLEGAHTFSPPHWQNYSDFNHENDGGNYDRCQGGFRNVEEPWCHEKQGEDDQNSRVERAQWGTNSAGIVHSATWQGPGTREALSKRVHNVRCTDRQ